MQNLSRVGEVRISPDGQWAVFTVTRSDLAENRSATNLWRVSTAGGKPEQLTFVDHGSNSTPRWSPDGRYLFFLSSRVDDKPQVFRLSVAGGDAMQVTTFATGGPTSSSLPTAIPLRSGAGSGATALSRLAWFTVQKWSSR
jgi:Tol biopolymer transport system component